MFKDDLGFNYQSWMSHPYYILIFQIYHIDYLNLNFTNLKYSDALTPESRGVNPILTHILTITST